jgi:hypothetical protein
MAKKANRPKPKSPPRPARPVAEPVAEPAQQPAAAEAAETTAAPRAPRAPKLSRSQAASERLEDEYAFISGDLRRVFILAAAMFALLIALNVIFNVLG